MLLAYHRTNIEYLKKLNPIYCFLYDRCIIWEWGSPLQNLIVRGHKEIMLTAIQSVSVVEAGSVFFKRPLSLSGNTEQIL